MAGLVPAIQADVGLWMAGINPAMTAGRSRLTYEGGNRAGTFNPRSTAGRAINA